MEDVNIVESSSDVILYNIDSFLCKEVKRKFRERGINFTDEQNCSIMIQKGIEQVPTVEYNDKRYVGFCASFTFTKGE